jgi:hypothetical protein
MELAGIDNKPQGTEHHERDAIGLAAVSKIGYFPGIDFD